MLYGRFGDVKKIICGLLHSARTGKALRKRLFFLIYEDKLMLIVTRTFHGRYRV